MMTKNLADSNHKSTAKKAEKRPPSPNIDISSRLHSAVDIVSSITLVSKPVAPDAQ